MVNLDLGRLYQQSQHLVEARYNLDELEFLAPCQIWSI